MSQNDPVSVGERERWRKAQDDLTQFQTTSAASPVEPVSRSTLRSDRRNYRQAMLGSVDAIEGRWSVHNGWAWLAIYKFAEVPAPALDEVVMLPCYFMYEGIESVLVGGTDTNLEYRQEAAMFVRGEVEPKEIKKNWTLAASDGDPTHVHEWRDTGFVNIDDCECGATQAHSSRPGNASILDQWHKAAPLNPDAEGGIEEPPPEPGQGDMWLDIIADMQQRRTYGIEKYGQPVQTFTGRRALKDAYAEQLDLIVYTRQQIAEDEMIRALVGVAVNALYSSNPDVIGKGHSALLEAANLLGVLPR